MGNDNVFSGKPAANAAGAAPQSGQTQTDGLLKGGWNDLAQDLARVYAVQRISGGSPVAKADTVVVSASQTPTTQISATRGGAMGFLASPMGLGLLALGAVALFFVLRK